MIVNEISDVSMICDFCHFCTFLVRTSLMHSLMHFASWNNGNIHNVLYAHFVLCTSTIAYRELTHMHKNVNGYNSATVSNITFSLSPVDSTRF